MKKSAFLDKLGERLGRIDKEELFHLLTDVSDQKAALESALQCLDAGIILVDGSGKIVFANRRASGLLGWNARPAAGMAIASLLTDSSMAGVFSDACRQSTQCLHKEIQVYSPRAMLLSMDFMPIRGEAQDAASMAVILEDISEKRRMEERMVQSEKLGALSILAAGLAHEIGNPLNSINIHLQLMEREIKKLKGAHKIQKLNATVQQEIQRLDDIVHRFLVAIRPLKPKLEKCSVNDLVRDVLRFLKHELARQEIQCDIRLDEAVVRTLLDPAHIKQALINLVKNAMQAMSKRGVLSVSTAMKVAAICIRIQDSGEGIAPEHLSKIFDPYFTTRENGSGLGLMMTHRIIKEHGGEVEVKSRMGKGTEFVLTLPVRPDQPKMISDTISPASAEAQKDQTA